MSKRHSFSIGGGLGTVGLALLIAGLVVGIPGLWIAGAVLMGASVLGAIVALAFAAIVVANVGTIVEKFTKDGELSKYRSIEKSIKGTIRDNGVIEKVKVSSIIKHGPLQHDNDNKKLTVVSSIPSDKQPTSSYKDAVLSQKQAENSPIIRV